LTERFLKKNERILLYGIEMTEKTIVVSERMPLGEIITRYPRSIEVLQLYGIPCVGCHTDFSVSLMESAEKKGLSRERTSELVRLLNKRINEEPFPEQTGKGVPVVSITKKAAEKITELLQKQGKKIVGLRFAALPGGCSGFTYSLTFEEKPEKEDRVVESEGIKFFISESHLNILSGSRIDFVDSLQGSGFKINNPNAKNTCGCGQSFS
jgi:iron-sulfur cluster assembly accessory protein